MSLRRFLDAAYVCLVESYQAAGMNLLEALEATAEYRAGSNRQAVLPTDEAVSIQRNDRSMAELQRMLG